MQMALFLQGVPKAGISDFAYRPADAADRPSDRRHLCAVQALCRRQNWRRANSLRLSRSVQQGGGRQKAAGIPNKRTSIKISFYLGRWLQKRCRRKIDHQEMLMAWVRHPFLSWLIIVQKSNFFAISEEQVAAYDAFSCLSVNQQAAIGQPALPSKTIASNSGSWRKNATASTSSSGQRGPARSGAVM